MTDEPELTVEDQAALETDRARQQAEGEAEEQRFAAEIAAARKQMARPVLLPVDETHLRRRSLLARAVALQEAARRSRACRTVLTAGLDRGTDVTTADLADELGLPLDVVREENRALEQMGFASCPQAETWSYSISA